MDPVAGSTLCSVGIRASLLPLSCVAGVTGVHVIPNTPLPTSRLGKIQAHPGVQRLPGPLSIGQMCFLGSSFRVTWW